MNNTPCPFCCVCMHTWDSCHFPIPWEKCCWFLDYKKDMEIKMKSEQCPLFSFCNCKTAVCRVTTPDESCYWYRYFKELIKGVGNEYNIL